MSQFTMYSILLPIIWFFLSGLIFQGSSSSATSAITHMQYVMQCDYPDYNLGGNSTGKGCIGDHPSAYSTDVYVLWNFTVGGGFWSGGSTFQWVAGIPIGPIDYAIAVIGVTFLKMITYIGYPFILVAVWTTPIDLVSKVPVLATPYAILWMLFFYGVKEELIKFIKAVRG